MTLRGEEHSFGVYTLKYVLVWIESNLEPDDVFEEKDLRAWAFDNGFILEKESN